MAILVDAEAADLPLLRPIFLNLHIQNKTNVAVIGPSDVADAIDAYLAQKVSVHA
jgi:hypothetical protein